MSGKVTSQVRLLQGKTVLEDDWRLGEYSLTEGAMISALFEPDVKINVEVSMGFQLHQLTVSNSMSIMALKSQICGVMRCGVAPDKLEIRLGDVTLEDPMLLYFYGIKNGSKLNVLKPYVNVTVMNNKGTEIFWRLNRKDSIKEIKAKLATVQASSSKFSFNQINNFIYGDYFPDDRTSPDSSRLYFVAEGQHFVELEDDDVVETYKIKDDDRLFLLSYRWTINSNVFVTKFGRNVQGVEIGDTCLTIKLKAQDQLGIPVNTLKLFHGENSSTEVQHYYYDKDRDNNTKPVSQKKGSLLVMITEEELQAEDAKAEVAAAQSGLTMEAYQEQMAQKLEKERKKRQKTVTVRVTHR